MHIRRNGFGVDINGESDMKLNWIWIWIIHHYTLIIREIKGELLKSNCEVEFDKYIVITCMKYRSGNILGTLK